MRLYENFTIKYAQIKYIKYLKKKENSYIYCRNVSIQFNLIYLEMNSEYKYK